MAASAPIIKPIFLSIILAISVAFFSSSPSLSQSLPVGDFQEFCGHANQAAYCIKTIDEYTAQPILKVNDQGWLQILKLKALSLLSSTITGIDNAIQVGPPTVVLDALTFCKSVAINTTISYLSPLDFTVISHDQYIKYQLESASAYTSFVYCINYFNRIFPVQNPVGVLIDQTYETLKLLLECVNIYQCKQKSSCL
ncbi:OLC1v1026337C1 [Oldenlandia corymbosa var. corymbosa]|uniref:OLC1v1026337C1 n=1 Tax=Oldenlandia corymbosa var. corymbosa TaxID=529605 RepID=A0AAV1C9U0_OLDCO|nr:OLC1v1026337C1 [Oldenlandia corymbosa var. corymbosa]